MNEANRRWRRKNLAHCAHKMREWRAKNREHYRAWVEARREHDGQRARARRKAVRGRVCSDCGRSDAEASWSTVNGCCARCHWRIQVNGRCRRCQAPRVRARAAWGPASKGKRGKKVCPEKCARVRAIPVFQSLLWDALRWNRETKITMRMLAQRMGITLRTIERRQREILAIMRRFDPEARMDFEADAGGTKFFSFRAGLVARGLEQMALATA